MRALLDIHLLIALLDPDHAFHERAHAWWSAHSGLGWSSCPITENGVVRIMSNPQYSRQAHFSPQDLIQRLKGFAANTDHEFWADQLSLLDSAVFVPDRIHSPRQLTDIYLLALATAHKARLATFDQSIPLSTVRSATRRNLCIL